MALAVLGGSCVAFTAMAATGVWKEHEVLGDWVYNGLLLGGALLCVSRAVLVREHRSAWVAIAVGALFNLVGEVYWVLFLKHSESVPYPSLADAFWLAVYPPMALGLWLLLARTEAHAESGKWGWLEGVVAALAGTALAAATLLAAPLEAAIEGNTLVFATNLAYPLADLLLLGIVLALCGRSGWHVGVVGGVLAAALVVRALTDFVYLDEVTRGTYLDGGLLDAGWPISAFLAAAAGCFFVTEKRRPPDWRVYAGLFASMSAALALLVYDHFDRVSALALVLAAIALALGVVRAVLSSRAFLTISRQEALTDQLTGLPNRRALMRDLENALADATSAGHVTLVSFDLNGFKRYNDSFGHPAGDALLARLGVRLAAAVAGTGAAYRMGGDEFYVLLHPGTDALVKASVSALRETGEGFTVTTAHGVVSLPDEADEVETALQLVDRRLYAKKLSRHAGSDTVEVLMRALHESEPAIETHLSNVGWLARAVARRLGLSAEQVDEITRAGQLHDIGKLAIPDAILHKRAPLSHAEWEFMHSHTVIGERILAAAPPLLPISRIVRSTHERWDGGGYPDGLAGEQIPLGARIVFACDAYDAITTARDYRAGRDPDEAAAELRRCSGAQFDPQVVDTLLCVLEREEAAPTPGHSLQQRGSHGQPVLTANLT